MEPPPRHECLIIGAGPAGLTAATRLARFRRRVLVVDGGASRASRIPVSRNLPGFPDGVPGPEMLDRMRTQALRHGARIVPGQVERLDRLPGGGFAATLGGRPVEAECVLMATGALDVEPALPGIRDAVRRGLVRHCPICDAHEATGQKVALIAYGTCRIEEALLLRAYTADLTVLTLGRGMSISPEQRAELAEASIRILEDPVAEVAMEGDKIVAWHMQGGGTHGFDAVYTALGITIRSGLATALGAAADEDGALIVRDRQQTNVPGLYAAGDVVRGLSQVAMAVGQAAVAATDMHRRLPLPRPGR